MSEPVDGNGWAPPDPGASTPDPSPHANQYGTREPHDQPYGRPYEEPPQPQQPYAQDPYAQDPYAQDPYGGQYGQDPSGRQYGQQYGRQPYAYPPQQPPYQYGASQPYPQYGPPPRQVRRPWAVPTPPGSPFHRMARTDVHRWWRPLVGTLAIVLVGFAGIIVLMVVLLVAVAMATGRTPISDTGGDSLFENPTADLAFSLASLAVFLPVVLGATWLIQRRAPGTLSSVAGRLRRRWMLVCCGAAIAFCAVSYGSSWLAGELMNDSSDAGDHWVGWGDFVGPALVIVFLVPFQSAAEEYAFRGWVMQALGACTLETRTGKVGRAFSVVFRTPWPGIVVGAALFTAGHGYTGWGMLDIFFFGAMAGWLAVRTGGLEASISLHVFNNLMAFLLPAAVGKLDIEQGGVPWQYVLADIVPMVLYAVVILWLVRRMRIDTVTTGHVPAKDAPVEAPAHAAVDTPPTAYDPYTAGTPSDPYGALHDDRRSWSSRP